MSCRVLVAYGSKYGSTAEIANAIATTLRVAGLEVDVRRAREVRSLDRYRVVVLGSAVYMARWRRDAMRLLRRRRELGEREVWLFSSGPVGEVKDEPAEQRDRWTKPKRVEQLAAQVMANEHVVFGGRISDDAGRICGAPGVIVGDSGAGDRLGFPGLSRLSSLLAGCGGGRWGTRTGSDRRFAAV